MKTLRLLAIPTLGLASTLAFAPAAMAGEPVQANLAHTHSTATVRGRNNTVNQVNLILQKNKNDNPDDGGYDDGGYDDGGYGGGGF